MSENLEPSLLKYARFYDLTVDHRAADPLAALLIKNDTSALFEHDDYLFRIEDNADLDLDDRLVAGKHEALLLSSVTEVSREPLRFDEMDQLDTHRIRNLMVETPILMTHHESDMRSFQDPIVPDLANEHLPLEALDEDADEGLTWPSTYQQLPEKYTLMARKDHLEISLDGLSYLQVCLPNLTLEEQMLFEDDVLNYVRVCSLCMCLIRR